jgi:YD repeat-containing protein
VNGRLVATYTYEQGDIKTQTDAAGRVTTYNYDAARRLVSINDPFFGLSTEIAYDANGRPVSQRVLNTVSTYAYDARGNVTNTATQINASSGPITGLTGTSYETANYFTPPTDQPASGSVTMWERGRRFVAAGSNVEVPFAVGEGASTVSSESCKKLEDGTCSVQQTATDENGNETKTCSYTLNTTNDPREDICKSEENYCLQCENGNCTETVTKPGLCEDSFPRPGSVPAPVVTKTSSQLNMQ